MSTEERKIQLGVEVNGADARAGLGEVGQAAREMAGEVAQSATAAGRAVDGIGNGGDAAAKKVDVATRSLIGSIQRTTAVMEAGSKTSVQYYEVLASQRGVDVNALRPYLAQLEEVSAKQKAATGALTAGAGSLEQVGMSAKATAAAMRNVPAQFTDIITSLQGGQKPLTVLLQQGGQLKDMFGGVGEATKALGTYVIGLINPFTIAAAAVGVLAVAYNEGSKETDAYNKALILSGNVAGTSAGQLSNMAKVISASVGTQGAAAEALAAIAGTGKVSAANLQQFAELAVKGQRALGQSVAQTAQEFADLGKKPVETLEKLGEKYPFLTGAIYDQVKALRDQGKATEAGATAQQAYAAAFDDVTSKVTANLGTMERLWVGVKDAAKSAWDGMLNAGRTASLEDQLGVVRKHISEAQSMSDHAIGSLALKGQLPKNIELEQSLLRQIALRDHLAALDKFRGEFNAADLAWSKGKEQFLTRQQQLERDVVKARNEGESAGVSDADINARVEKIKQGYSDLSNASMAGLEAQRKLEQIGLKGSEAELEDSFKRRLIGEVAYIDSKRDLQLKEIDGEIALTKKKAEIAGGKEDKSEQVRLLGDLKVFAVQRNQIISKANSEILESYKATGDSVDKQVRKWVDATADEHAQIAQEVTLFGQSADARAVAVAQIKIEAEARSLLDKAKEEGKTLLPDEIAKIYLEAEARKKNAAAAIYENTAIAGANQLRQENLKFGAEYIADEQVRAAKLIEIDADVWREKIRNAEEGAEAQKLLQEQFDQWYANRQLAPVLDRWKGIISSLDRNFSDGFRNMLNNGKNAWSSFAKSIGDTLKTALADAIYQTFIKKYVIQIVAGFAGAISGSGVGAALSGDSTAPSAIGGDAGKAITIAQAAKGAYDLLQGGAAGALGTGISSLGSLTGSATLSGFGSGLAGTSVASQAGATASGAALSEGATAAESAGLAFSKAIPIIGWIIAGMLKSASLYDQGWRLKGQDGIRNQSDLSNQFNEKGLTALGISDRTAGIITGSPIQTALFGHKAPQVESAGLRGTLSLNGLDGQTFQNILEKGGFFRSDKRHTDTQALSADLQSLFTDSIRGITATVKGFADILGVSSDKIGSYSKDINIALTSDEAKNREAIGAVFGGVGDDLARILVPTIDQFAKAGESTSATMQRLANDFTATNQIAQMLGKTAAEAFGAVGLASVTARERLIDLSGGVAALVSKSNFFTQNFLGESERIAPVLKSVSDAMGALGLSGISTVEQFKSIVSGINLSTEAGAKEYAALLDLAPAFKQAADYTAALKKATDDKAASDKAAADALASSVAKEQRSLNIQLMRALGNEEGALAAERKDALDSLLTDKARFTQAQIYAANDAAAAIAKAQESAAAHQAATAQAYTDFGNALVENMRKATEAAAALRKFNDQLLVGSASPLDANAKYAVAKEQFQKAAPEDLQAAATTFLDASKARGAGGLAYAQDFAAVRSAISGAATAKDSYAASIPAFFRSLQQSGIFGAHANGGIASGWSIVGENGPEFANFTQPARIYTAAQSRDMMAGPNNGQLAVEVRQLREELTTAMSYMNISSKAAADTLDDIAHGRVALQTEVAV